MDNKEPSIFMAIIGLFMGYPALAVICILLAPFTFLMSLGIIVYVNIIAISILWGVMWLFQVTIPTIIYYRKYDIRLYEKSKTIGMAISFIVLIIAILGLGMNHFMPEVCQDLYQSNLTSQGNLAERFC